MGALVDIIKQLGSTGHSCARVEGKLPEGAGQGDVTRVQDTAVFVLVPELCTEPVQPGLARVLQV